jgi:hypothetical protein
MLMLLYMANMMPGQQAHRHDDTSRRINAYGNNVH